MRLKSLSHVWPFLKIIISSSLYTSKPTYEKGKELGNEKGYVVRMSRSYLEYLELGSIKIKDDEIVIVKIRYKNGFRIRAIGHM
jgi:hypothetical protein